MAAAGCESSAASQRREVVIPWTTWSLLCNFCRSATSRMKFSQDQSAEEILESKRKHVSGRLKSLYKFWSNEAAPRDAALAPEQGGTYLPNPLVLDFRALDLTGDQLLRFCSDNDNLRFELTSKKELVVMPPVWLRSGWQEGTLFLQLANWAAQDGTGTAFNASAGFTLLNGAVRAPDCSWILRERLDALEEDEWRSFAHICPDFVLELRSASETLASQQAKMEEYIQNGARLGWLVDPIQKRVHVYRPGAHAEVLDRSIDGVRRPGDARIPARPSRDLVTRSNNAGIR